MVYINPFTSSTINSLLLNKNQHRFSLVRKMRNILLLCLFFNTLPYLADADEVILKSGKKIEATILEKSNTYIIIDSDIGQTLTYYLDEIDSINGQPPTLAIKTPTTPVSIDLPPQTDITRKETTYQVYTIEDNTKTILTNTPDKNTPHHIPDDDSSKYIQTTDEIKTSSDNNIVVLKRTRVVTQNQIPTSQATPTTSNASIKVKVNQDNHVDNSTYHNSSFSNFATFFASFWGLILIIALITLMSFMIFPSICLFKISKKTNKGEAWMAWLPIANWFLMCKIGSVRYELLFTVVLGFIPIVGWIVVYALFAFIWSRIAITLNKPAWLGILCVLPLVNLVALGYLAFSD